MVAQLSVAPFEIIGLGPVFSLCTEPRARDAGVLYSVAHNCFLFFFRSTKSMQRDANTENDDRPNQPCSRAKKKEKKHSSSPAILLFVPLRLQEQVKKKKKLVVVVVVVANSGSGGDISVPMTYTCHLVPLLI